MHSVLFWEIEYTPNRGRSFPHWLASIPALAGRDLGCGLGSSHVISRGAALGPGAGGCRRAPRRSSNLSKVASIQPTQSYARWSNTVGR